MTGRRVATSQFGTARLGSAESAWRASQLHCGPMPATERESPRPPWQPGAHLDERLDQVPT
nr:hypothetical protein JVH1_5074 [Rhodococcus sp. JVH1]